jgi:hypothetical protein
LEGVTDRDRHSHQAPKQSVPLPMSVVAACTVTSQLKLGALSKKCQVQAHIALTSDGSMPQDKARQRGLPTKSPYCQIRAIAAIHSSTLDTCTIQVGIDKAFMTNLQHDALMVVG